MITRDHPTTARAIGREAGILGHGNGQLLTGTEIAELSDEELDERLQRATIIARATPLDKLRIVESFQLLGHCVAMTGDGVNDAPALRLADVGVAMGDHGTDVARHAADLVLTNDDFSTLVESFVEGRVFWSNIRRALGLLLGGNVGEIGLMAVPNLLGTISPLTPRQVLAVNMITDALPALAVTLQEPEHRNLATLAREGAAALGVPLRNDIAFRAIATQVPSLLAYFISLRYLGPVQGRSVAFASVIATQLAQTFDAVWTNQEMSKPMVVAMAGSALFLATSITVPFLQVFLGLSPLSLTGWLLAGVAAIAAVPLSRLLAWIEEEMRSEEVESEAALAA
jgi:cation-transporting P-type ATPase I